MKKIGEKYWLGKKNHGKISPGKNLVTCKKFSHLSSNFFPLQGAVIVKQKTLQKTKLKNTNLLKEKFLKIMLI